MNTQVRKFLIELARKSGNEKITYQKLSDECKLKLNMSNQSDRNIIAEMLGEISKFEHENGRPLISSLVRRKNDNHEGDGFYKLAERLGYGDWKKLKRDGVFEFEEIKKSIAFWANNEKYLTYKDA